MGSSFRIAILPAYNEAESLPTLLKNLSETCAGLHCVVIDDGSQDDTGRIARALGAEVIRHPFNLGYGAALQSGYKYALEIGADFLVQLDADEQHNPGDVRKLLDPVERDECDLMIGSRFHEKTDYSMGAARRIGRDLFRVMARLFGLTITDPTSGFQAMNRKVIEIYTDDFFPSDYPDVDVLVRLHRQSVRIRECSVHMSDAARASRIHGGLRVVYYVYKMLLSLWLVSSSKSKKGAGSKVRDGKDR